MSYKDVVRITEYSFNFTAKSLNLTLAWLDELESHLYLYALVAQHNKAK